MSTIKHSQISALLVDDDAKLCGLLRDYLEGFGFSLDVAEDASSGLEKAVANEYDVILLDMMLPDMDGLDVLRRLREIGSTPIVIFSAQDEEASRIVGLEMGADDYVPKAFSPRELLARVRAVLRRAQPVQAERKEPEEDGVVRVRGLWMDRKSMKARMDGVPMDLTALEFRILFGMAAIRDGSSPARTCLSLPWAANSAGMTVPWTCTSPRSGANSETIPITRPI